MNNAPCKGCLNRYVGCHSECKKYLDFKKELEKAKAKERARKKIESDIWDGIRMSTKFRG